MADNVTVDNGALTDYEVVTDEITSPYTGGTKQAQGVKILSGTANANDVIPGDATNGLDVDVTRVQGTVAVTQSGTWDEVGINDSGNSITVDDGGSSLTVDGTVSVSGTTTVDSELPAAAALADNTANPTAPAVGSFGHVWDGATWDRAPGTAADGTLVNLGANNDVTVTGTVTSTPSGDHTVVGKAADGAAVSGNPVLIAGQDGTNVQSLKTDNTGSLQVDVESSALPTGAATLAEQQTQTTSLSVLDDWDETDRAKVNLIVGQAGVAAGAGAVSATTQRVTVATDDVVGVKERRSSTTALTTVADTASSATILASNANRIKATITNDSSARLYLRFEAAVASTSNYGVSLSQHETWEELVYTGEIRGIWASDPNDGAARVVEFT